MYRATDHLPCLWGTTKNPGQCPDCGRQGVRNKIPEKRALKVSAGTKGGGHCEGVRNELRFLNANLCSLFEIDKDGLSEENLGYVPIPGSFGKEAVDVPEYLSADS